MDDVEFKPQDLAVTLHKRGKSQADIWTALVADGMDPTEAEAHVKGLYVAASMLEQNQSPADIWSALVADGVPEANAESLVRDLSELHHEQRRERIRKLADEEDQVASGFCTRCYNETTCVSTGNIASFNGIGTTFYGDDRACGMCGSVVAVHWVIIFHIPFVPIRTYRLRRFDGGMKFSARQTATNPKQIALHYSIALGLIIACVAFGLYMGGSRSRGCG